MLAAPVTGMLVQLVNVGTGVREHQSRGLWILLSVSYPRVEKRGVRFGMGGVLKEATLPFVGFERLRGLAVRQLMGCVPLPEVGLAPDFIELGCAALSDDAAEAGTRFNSLELFGMADENPFC